MNRLLVQGPLAGPAAGEVTEGVVSRRQGPFGSGSLFHGYGLRVFVLEGGRTRQDSGVRIDSVVQRDIDLARNIFQHYVKAVCGCGVAEVVENQVAVSVGKGDLQGRLGEQSCAPAGVLLRGVVIGGVEGSPLGERRGLLKAVRCRQPCAPVKLLQFPTRVHAKNIRDIAAIEPENLRGCVEAHGRRLRKRGNWNRKKEEYGGKGLKHR